MAITNKYESGLFDLAKKYGIEDYVLGQSFDKYKPQMSATDIELGNKLLHYYNQENNAIEQHNTAVQKIYNNAKKQIEDAQINRTKVAHYLNNYNQANGLGGFGASQSSIIDLYNNYQNQRADIMGQADSNKLDLENKFNTESNSLHNQYLGEVKEQKEDYSAISFANATIELNEMLGTMIGSDGKVSESDMEKINEWAEDVKSELVGTDLYEFEKSIESIKVRHDEKAYFDSLYKEVDFSVIENAYKTLKDMNIPITIPEFQDGKTYKVGSSEYLFKDNKWYKKR